MTTTSTTFLHAVETILQAAHVPFERRDLIDFLASCRPLIEDDPSPQRWAWEFLSIQLATAVPA